MIMKEMEYNEFKKKFMEKPVDCINDEGLAEMIKEIKEDIDGFEIIFKCKKCGAFDIQIIGEDGINYGGQTGYSSGSNVIKCKNCGNAVTVWK
jgi:uncharacterized Zn finger protein